MAVSGYSSLVTCQSECVKDLPVITEVAQHCDLGKGLDQDQRGLGLSRSAQQHAMRIEDGYLPHCAHTCGELTLWRNVCWEVLI